MSNPDRSSLPPGRRDRLALWAGIASIVMSAVGILAATLLAPWFSWTGNALSDLGAAGESTALLFNGTLFVAGLLGVPFALRVLDARANRLRWIGTTLFGASMPMLALVGVFALPSPYHAPVAVAFFLLFTLGLFVDGLGALRTGERRAGRISVTLAATHVLAWVAWGVSGLEGVAIPEMVGTIAIWLWVLRRFVELR